MILVRSHGHSAKNNSISCLRNEAVEVGVSRPLDIERSATDVIDGLIVEEHRNVGVLEQRVRGEDAVVRLHHRGRDLRGRIHSETELRLLSVVDGETLQEQRSKSRSGPSSDGIEYQKALQTSAIVSELPDPIQAQVNDLLPN